LDSQGRPPRKAAKSSYEITSRAPTRRIGIPLHLSVDNVSARVSLNDRAIEAIEIGGSRFFLGHVISLVHYDGSLLIVSHRDEALVRILIAATGGSTRAPRRCGGFSTPDEMTTPSPGNRDLRSIRSAIDGYAADKKHRKRPSGTCHGPSGRYRVDSYAFLSCHPHRWTVSSPGPCPSSRLFPVESWLPMRDSPRGALADVLDRVRAEYREMPGLRLTPSQAIRLFGVEPSVCATMLNALVNEHFLLRTTGGLFVQSST